MEKLTDTSKMPYGKYKELSMANVPDNYLKWFYEQNKPIIDYIEENMDSICKQNFTPYPNVNKKNTCTHCGHQSFTVENSTVRCRNCNRIY